MDAAGPGFLVGLADVPVSRSRVYRAFARWSKAIGIEVHPHDLRRSALTIMAGKGAAPTALMAFAGHSSVSVTMRHYVVADAAPCASLL